MIKCCNGVFRHHLSSWNIVSFCDFLLCSTDQSYEVPQHTSLSTNNGASNSSYLSPSFTRRYQTRSQVKVSMGRSHKGVSFYFLSYLHKVFFYYPHKCLGLIIFHPSRILHQGCPLSPLHFIIVADALRQHINHEGSLGNLKGIKI